MTLPIFHLTFEHGLKNGAKNLLQDVLYVFRALDVVVVEDLLSNLLAWGSWWSFTLCHSVTVLIFVYPSMGHKVDSCNTDLHKLFYTPKDYKFIQSKKRIQLRINRSIQIEGAFGTVKGNYEYRRVRHKGKESVEKELLFMAFGFDLRKYRSRRDTDRLQQHYLEKEETHTVAC